MKIGLNIFWQHYKWLDNKELFSKTLKNWLLGILYRYIHWCIDTNVLKLLRSDFGYFVSIHILSVSIQKWFLRGRELPVYRIMLACIDTHLYLSENQRVHDVSNHACMIWYISVKISRVWCLYRYIPCLYRYKGQFFQFLTLVKTFVSIHVWKIMPKFAHSIFSLNSNVWVPL